jgi:hypothetical protein
MRYAWKVSRLRHLIFATDRPIVLGGLAMAMDRRNKRVVNQRISTLGTQPPAPRPLPPMRNSRSNLLGCCRHVVHRRD